MIFVLLLFKGLQFTQMVLGEKREILFVGVHRRGLMPTFESHTHSLSFCACWCFHENGFEVCVLCAQLIEMVHFYHFVVVEHLSESATRNRTMNMLARMGQAALSAMKSRTSSSLRRMWTWNFHCLKFSLANLVMFACEELLIAKGP